LRDNLDSQADRPASRQAGFLPRFRVTRYAGAPAGGAVPRSKYTKGPGPFLPLDRVVSDVFRFDETARRELIVRLPLQFRQTDLPEEIKQLASKLPGTPKPKTIAELIILDTENLISSYRKAKNVIGSRAITPAQVRAAIRKLREALKPFVEEWVDDETAALIPEGLDKRLASRELALQDRHIAPLKQGIDSLCEVIGNLLNRHATEFQVIFRDREKIQYIVTALDHAGIEHSYSKENPSRFAARVFPKPKNSKYGFEDKT
jgi:hypothetical protein